MKNEAPQNDNITLLIKRQNEVLNLFHKGMMNGLTTEEWATLINSKLLGAELGFGSQRAVKAIDYYTDHGLYKIPYRVKQLRRLLGPEFANVRRLYVEKGWTTQDPMSENTPDHTYRATTSGEPPTMISPQEELEYMQQIDEDEQ